MIINGLQNYLWCKSGLQTDEKLPDAFFSKASIYTVENGTLTAQ